MILALIAVILGVISVLLSSLVFVLVGMGIMDERMDKRPDVVGVISIYGLIMLASGFVLIILGQGGWR